MAGALLLAYAVAFPAPALAQSTDPVWSTTMTVGQGTGDNIGYVSSESAGTLDVAVFSVSGVDYTVTIVGVGSNRGAEFATDPILPNNNYTLEVAGAELFLADATSAGTRFYRWDPAWLTSNASSLDPDNFETTLPLSDEVTVCLRTATQVCSKAPDPLPWSTTMTVGDASGNGRGFQAAGFKNYDEAGSLGVSEFTVPGDQAYRVMLVAVDTDWHVNAGMYLDKNLANSNDYILEVAGEELPLSSSNGMDGQYFSWSNSWLAANAPALDADTYETTLPLGGEVQVCLRTETQVCPGGDPNSAMGRPTITGTAKVGQILTADTNAITDADGVPSTFTYQWLRLDAMGMAMNIGTASTYTVVAADVGSTIRVDVSFTDNAGNSEGPLASAETAAVPVPVTIAAEHEEIGGGVEDLKFTLTRTGDTTDALEDVMVTIAQAQSWLGSSDLSHTVTFLAGFATEELTIEATEFSLSPSTTGDLTATVSGDGIFGGSDTVEIISISEPPFTISYDMPEYTFAENAYTDIYVVSTLNAAYPRPPSPSRDFYLGYSTREDTATAPEDYPALSLQTEIDSSVYAHARDAETDPFVARMPLSDFDFAIVDDAIYEGPERFSLNIEASPGTPRGVAQLRNPDGTTCTIFVDCPNPPADFWVNITDEEDFPNPYWSTTMTVGVSADGRGYVPTEPAGSLVDDDFTEGGNTIVVSLLAVYENGSHFFLSEALSDKDLYILEVEGVELPLSEATGTNFLSWSPEWLVDNAPSLSLANYLTTLPDGGMVQVCLRTERQACPGGGTTNNPPIGKPTITGTAQVGQMLTADASAITDGDGLGAFTYRWVQVDALDNETDIGTDSSTYSPLAADEGSTIRVDVSFTDGASNLETVPSDAVGPVVAAAADCVDRPGYDWCTTMTVEVLPLGPVDLNAGYTSGGQGALDDTTIDYGSKSFTVGGLQTYSGAGTDYVQFAIENAVEFLPLGSVFNFGGTEFTVDASSEQSILGQYQWDRPANFGWSEGQYVTVSANLAPAPDSATVDGTTLVLTHAEDLDTGSTPAADSYTVKLDGSAGPAVSGVSVGARTVTLTLATAVTATDTDVTVDYEAPTSNPLQDVSGLDAPDSENFPVTNDTATTTTVPGAPTSLTATASGTTTIDLSWTAPGDNGGSAITGYKIEVSPNGTSSWSNRVADTGNTDTAYSHTGLDAGTTRHYRVSAINSVGTGAASNVDDATTDDATSTVPGVPTSLTATASGTTTIELSWTAPGDNGGSAITGYKIEVSPNGTSSWSNRVADTGNTDTAYSHTGLDAGTTRHYRVSAINSVGTGAASNVDDATTDDTTSTVPGAPTSLTATASGTTTIELSWTAPGDNGGSAITGYKIEVSPNGTSSWSNRVADTGNTDTAYSHTGLDAGTTRHYRVSAINSVGTGAASNVDDATTDDSTSTVPGAPTSLTATASGTTTIDLSWTAPGDNGGSAITGYKIEVSPNGTSSWSNRAADTGNTDTAYSHTGLDAGTTRHYRVSAINSVGTGAASNVDDATTDDATSTVPGAPTSLTATASGTTTIDLSWTAPGDNGGSAITGYKIEVSPNGTSSWSNRAADTGNTDTAYSHTGLDAGTTRHYRVSAINSVGTGAASNVDDATTDDATTQPAIESKDLVEVSEGSSASIAVTLSIAPTSNRTVDITSDDTGAVTVTPSSLTFTSANWNVEQWLDIRAVEDSDGDAEDVMVTLSGTGLTSKTVRVKVTDVDEAALVCDMSMETVTVHEGETAHFTIAIDPPLPKDDILLWYVHDYGDATTPEDLPSTSGRVHLNAGATRVDGSVETYEDDETEPTEGFQIVMDWDSWRKRPDWRSAPSCTGRIYIRDGESNGDPVFDDGESNGAPVFNDGESTKRKVAENTASGKPVGKPVRAEDPNGDPVTYSLEGRDAALFAIDAGTGQLRTVAALDYESKAAYEVTVRANDDWDDDPGTATIAVTVNVDDKREPPATPGEPEVKAIGRSLSVNWSAPENTGPPMMKYDLRYREMGRGWRTDAPRNLTKRSATLGGLEANTEYEVQVLARSDEGTSGWSKLTSEYTGVNAPPAFPKRTATRSIAENTASGRPIGDAVSANDPEGDKLTYTLEGPEAGSFRIDSGTGRLRTRAALDHESKASHTLTVKADDGEGGTATIEVTVIVTDVDEPLPAVSIGHARVQEGQGAVLEFAVTLDRGSSKTVTVEWETRDGTATAGNDYVEDSDTLIFQPSETSHTIQVEVLDDSHDEGNEVMRVVLSNPVEATIAQAKGRATGTIKNSDPMPAAWLTRFGRVASDHVVEAISDRWRDGERQTPQTHFTLGGRKVDKLFGGWDGIGGLFESSGPGQGNPALEDESTWARMDRLKAEALGPAGGLAGGSLAGGNPVGSSLTGGGSTGRNPAGSSLTGGGLAGGGTAGRSPGGGARSGGEAARSALMNRLGLPSGDLKDVLMGSSFFYSRPLDEDGRAERPGWLGQWSAWGETAATRFSGADGKLSLNGEVATAILGMDSRRDRWLAGVTLSQSMGEGVYTHPTAAGGAVSSTLTSLNPYVHYRFNERTSFWGVAGYGVGGLKLTPDGVETGIETDMATAMAAFGGRGVLSVRTGGAGRFELALRSDALLTNTDSEAVQGLAGAQGATSRVRLVLEGSGSLPVRGGVLRPTLEAGLRYDGGDAETGAGLEVGGGLGYAAGNLSLEVKARALVAHQDTEYEEWGFSGSVVYTPGKDRRGLSMKLGSAWGSTQSGVQSLWSRQDASGLARGAAMNAAQRFQAELGYGFAGRRNADALWVPFLGAESGEGAAQSLRMGVRLTSGTNVEMGLELGRREGRAGAAPEQTLQLRGALRW